MVAGRWGWWINTHQWKKKKSSCPEASPWTEESLFIYIFLWTRLNTEKHHIRNILDCTLVFLNHGLILQNRLNIKWLNCLIMLTWARYLNQGCVKLIRVHNFDWRRTRGFIDRCSQCYKTGTTFFLRNHLSFTGLSTWQRTLLNSQLSVGKTHGTGKVGFIMDIGWRCSKTCSVNKHNLFLKSVVPPWGQNFFHARKSVS